MPTKPNYGGEQQPYVPQGNGDPSGEYADDAGANVNYKARKDEFRKAFVERQMKMEKKKEAPAKPGADFKPFTDLVVNGSKMDEKWKREFAKTAEKADKSVLAIETSAIQKRKAKIEMIGGTPNCNQATISLNKDSRPRTIYHEFGHLADFSENYFMPLSFTETVVEGKTMQETLKEECKAYFNSQEFNNKSAQYEGLMNEMREHNRDRLKKADSDPDFVKFEKKIDDYEKKISEVEDAIASRNGGNWMRSQAVAILRNQGIEDPAKSDEAKTITERHFHMAFDEDEKSADIDKRISDFRDRYGAISDAYSITKKVTGGCYDWGHHANYYRSRPWALGAEVFADLCGTLGANGEQSEEYAYFKKNFPKSSVAFERIIAKLGGKK